MNFKVVSLFNFQCSCRLSDFSILSDCCHLVNPFFRSQLSENQSNAFRQLTYDTSIYLWCQPHFSTFFLKKQSDIIHCITHFFMILTPHKFIQEWYESQVFAPLIKSSSNNLSYESNHVNKNHALFVFQFLYLHFHKQHDINI